VPKNEGEKKKVQPTEEASLRKKKKRFRPVNLRPPQRSEKKEFFVRGEGEMRTVYLDRDSVAGFFGGKEQCNFRLIGG